MTRTKIERARTALVIAKQSNMKNIYRRQQRIDEANLSQRINTFLKHLEKLDEAQEQ